MICTLLLISFHLNTILNSEGQDLGQLRKLQGGLIQPYLSFVIQMLPAVFLNLSIILYMQRNEWGATRTPLSIFSYLSDALNFLDIERIPRFKPQFLTQCSCLWCISEGCGKITFLRCLLKCNSKPLLLNTYCIL